MSNLIRSDYQPLTLRKQLISGYETLIQEITENENAEAYYLNFMFKQLPVGKATQIEIMKQEVTRFHCLLKRHVVRKPDAPGWRDLVPVLVGLPDYPVPKKKKVSARLFRVNEGIHFNAVVLLPPRPEPPKIVGFRESRLKVPLDIHVKQREAEFLTDRLYRIDVTPIREGTTMADYTFKAFVRGRVKSDDILVLN
jgi:hypothetical protein